MRLLVALLAALAALTLAGPAAPAKGAAKPAAKAAAKPAPKAKAKPKAKPAPTEKPTGHTALYDHVMKKYDVNRNKKLDDDERVKIRDAFLAGDFMLGKMDTDGNKALSGSEFEVIENEKAVKPAAPKKKKK